MPNRAGNLPRTELFHTDAPVARELAAPGQNQRGDQHRVRERCQASNACALTAFSMRALE